MARAKRGPKASASGWLHVYNQPKRPGETRWVFWRGPGTPKFLVRGNDLTSDAFRVAYYRFMAGLHPYEDRNATAAKQRKRVASAQESSQFAQGTWGWLVLKYIASDDFKRQINMRAIENQLRWTLTQPVNRERPEGRLFGEFPLNQLEPEHFQKLLARKVATSRLEKKDPETGRKVAIVNTAGAAQANNIIKWLRPIGKLAVKERLWKHNIIFDIEKNKVRTAGFRMWTDEIWDQVCAAYPLGTKARLVFDLAGFTGQRRGDVTFLGAHCYIPPEPGLPFGSLEIHQEKGSKDGDAYVAHVPIVDELYRSLEAARKAGILGSRFYIRQDGKDEPYTKEALGNKVREWLNEAEVPKGYSLHGLRKLFVCRLIERGCAPHDVMAATGHRTLKEVDRYARDYFRKKKKTVVYEKWRESAIRVGAASEEREVA